MPSQDLCNPEAGYEPETAANSIELKKGEYHDYHVYLCATRYTIQPGHSLTLVIATEDPVNCLIHKTYSIEIDNTSVNANCSGHSGNKRPHNDAEVIKSTEMI